MEVVLSIRTPEGWIAEVQERYQASIKILGCKHTEQGFEDLVEVGAPNGALRRVLEGIQASRHVVSANVMQIGVDRAVAIVKSQMCRVCHSFLSPDVFLRGAVTRPDATSEWTLTIAGTDALRRVIKSLHDAEILVRVKKIAKLDRMDLITARQEQVLSIAMQEGYYEFPRRIKQTDLAGKMGMATPTVSEILRRAERKIIGEFLRKGGADRPLP